MPFLQFKANMAKKGIFENKQPYKGVKKVSLVIKMA